MARGTKLDRADWGTMQHGTGAPTGATKGNQYLDDSTGIFWTRAAGSSWGQSELGDLWTVDSGALQPSDVTNDFTVNLAAIGGTGKITLISGGDDLAEGGDVTISANGNNADMRISTGGNSGNMEIITAASVGDMTISTFNSSNGDMLIKTGGASGNMDIEAVGGSGNMNVKTGGASGNYTYTTDGGLGNYSISTGGVEGNFTVNTSSSGNGDFTVNSVGSGNGDINLNAGGGNGDINLSTDGANGDVTITTNGAQGDILFDTNSGSGLFSFDSAGSSDGSFVVNAVGGGSYISLNCNGSTGSGDVSIATGINSGNFNVTTNGGSGNCLFTLNASGQGDFQIDASASNQGNFEFIGGANSGKFQVDCTAIQMNAIDGTVISNAGIGDGGYPDGVGFIKIGGNSGNDPLHLYSEQSDILLETVAAACSTDIILNSCDQIDMAAIGSVLINSGFTSNFNVNANQALDQTLTIGISNSGAGKGDLIFTADDDISFNGAGIFDVNTGGARTIQGSGLTTIGGGGGIVLSSPSVNLNTGDVQVSGISGATGSFTTVDGKTVTVTKGIITNIV